MSESDSDGSSRPSSGRDADRSGAAAPSARAADSHAAWTAVPPHVLWAGVLVLIAIIYLPTLAFDFVYDDHWTIAANGFLREPDLRLLWSGQAAAQHVPDAFRPTLVVFDVAAYQLVGLSAPLHHALSVLLHVAVCGALGLWLSRLRAPLALRIAAVGLFGVLAIHAEAVAVVSYREDLLAALFGLLALSAAELSAEAQTAGRRWSWATLAATLMALACGAKLSAAPLVAVFVLARWQSPWRPTALRASGVAVVALTIGVALALAQTVLVRDGLTPYAADDPRLMLPRVGWAATMATSATNLADMLRQFVLPLSLSPEYVDRPGSWSALPTWMCATGLGALLTWGVGTAVWWRRPVVALSVLGTLLLLVPVSGVVALPNMRADRFAYLPSALACVGLAAGLLAAGSAWQRRTPAAHPGWALAPLLGFAIVQGGLGQGAANTYRSDVRLWTIALRRAPDSPRAHAVFGQLLLRRAAAQERPDPMLIARSRAHCALALARDDGTALPQLCDARLAALERDWPRAYRRFEAGLTRSVDGGDRAMAGLASVTVDRPDVALSSRRQQALQTAERATEEFPFSSEAHAVAGRLSHRLGDTDRAKYHYRRARSLRPERWDLVLAGLELQVDLGHPSAARLTWELYEVGLVGAVDLSRRKAVRRRLQDAERLFGTSLP